MRREMGMSKGGYELYGTLKPENHPDGTAISIRVFSLEGELLDDRKFVCQDTTVLQFGRVKPGNRPR